MNKVTIYQVLVRMEDRSARTPEQASPPGLGAKVNVEGDVLHADTQ